MACIGTSYEFHVSFILITTFYYKLKSKVVSVIILDIIYSRVQFNSPAAASMATSRRTRMHAHTHIVPLLE